MKGSNYPKEKFISYPGGSREPLEFMEWVVGGEPEETGVKKIQTNPKPRDESMSRRK